MGMYGFDYCSFICRGIICRLFFCVAGIAFEFCVLNSVFNLNWMAFPLGENKTR